MVWVQKTKQKKHNKKQSTKNLQGNLKNQVSPGGSWKKADPAVGFAPKFCAECNGRELNSSHGNDFCELFDLPANWRQLQHLALDPAPAPLSQQNANQKIKRAPPRRMKKEKTKLWRWTRLQRHMFIFLLIHVGRGHGPFGPSAQVGPQPHELKKWKQFF